MAEHPAGGETLPRRSRRLDKGACLGLTEAREGDQCLVKAAGVTVVDQENPVGERSPQNGAGEGKVGTAANVQADGSPQNGIEIGNPVGEATEVVAPLQLSVSGDEATATGNSEDDKKRKHKEADPDPCKRPLLGVREPKASKDNHSSKNEAMIPKGKPKSGRIWKDVNKTRFSGMIKDRPLHTSWEKKMKARREKSLVKDFARHLQDEKRRAKEEKKQRREENLKQRLANERKAEVVQVITNIAKIKRAKKKQLRRIEKRDTLALLQGRSGPRKKTADKAGPHKKTADKAKRGGKVKPTAEAKPNTN